MKISIGFVLAAAVATTAAAASPASPNIVAVTKLLAASSHNSAVRALSAFDGAHGLHGVVFENAATHERNVAWLTPDGKAVIPGPVYDATGTDLTQQARYTQGILFAPDHALKLAADPTSRPLLLGNRGPILTMFFDPNCIYCHQLYSDLHKPLSEGKLRVRIVLVGVVKTDSADRAATILAARDPASALKLDETDFDVPREEGGLPIDNAAATSSYRATVESNGALMVRAGGVGTPTLLFCDVKSGHVEMQNGVPANLDTLIDSLGSQCK